MSRPWSNEEEFLLEEWWGTKKLPYICENLNRSKHAVISRARKMKLGAYLDCGDYITLHQLLQAVTASSTSDTYKLKSWVEKRNLPIKRKKVDNCYFRVIEINDFWKWAEKNRSFIDFSKMEPLILGEEPDWVAEQRSKDFKSFALQRKDPWTGAEDNRLKSLVRMQKYGYAEISQMMHRSEGAIQRRLTDLGIKDRPVKALNHGESSEWKPEHFRILEEGIKSGDSYPMIGQKLGKSEKAIRGKVYFTYLTESQDKVRQMMGAGHWGDGAPVPTVKQGRHLSRTRKEVCEDLTIFAELLQLRLNDLGYEPYWQRHMCMNWDDLTGCKAGQTNCDECASFRRIRPQYCARCGSTFLEREENRFCPACRKARKKQAQRHWCRTHRLTQ